MDAKKLHIDKQSLVGLLKEEDKIGLFKKSKYLFGDLYWKRVNKKEVHLLNWGDCYSPQEIQKWTGLDLNLEIKANINFSWCSELSKNYDKIINLSLLKRPSEKERLDFFKELGFWFNKKSDDETLHQDLVIVTHYYFEDLSSSLELLFYKLPQEVRRRNMLIASHMVVILILSRYTNYEYLRDVYNTCLLLDYKLSFEMWSHREKENVLLFYKNEREAAEYIEKSMRTYRSQIKAELEKKLSFDGVELLLDVNFENFKGTGPLKKKMNDLSDEESILVSLIKVFSDFNKTTLLEKVVTPYKDMSFFSRRIAGFIQQSLGEVSDEYLEVEGL